MVTTDMKLTIWCKMVALQNYKADRRGMAFVTAYVAGWGGTVA
jgi:hypothetical protein